MFIVKVKETNMVPFAQEESYLIFERFSLGIKYPFGYETPDAFFYNRPVARGTVVALLSPYKKKSSMFRKILDFPVYLLSMGLWKLDKRAYVVRRVLAIPGDRVSINNKTIYLNGNIFVPSWPLHFEDIRVLPHQVSTRDHFNEVIVPGGYVFVLSDNWDVVTDSRGFGLVPIHRLEGNYGFPLLKSNPNP